MVRVTRDVEPVTRPAFAVSRGSEQAIDNPGKGFASRRRVGLKRGNFAGGGFRVTTVVPDAPGPGTLTRSPINTWTDAQGHGAVIALDPETGDRKWTYPMYDLTDSGILTTATDMLFTGSRDGFFQALDARTGALLWKSSLGSVQIRNSPMTYEVEGKQFVTIIAGNVLAVFGLRD